MDLANPYPVFQLIKIDEVKQKVKYASTLGRSMLVAGIPERMTSIADLGEVAGLLGGGDVGAWEGFALAPTSKHGGFGKCLRKVWAHSSADLLLIVREKIRRYPPLSGSISSQRSPFVRMQY